jgi:hypothetical protein
MERLRYEFGGLKEKKKAKRLAKKAEADRLRATKPGERIDAAHAQSDTRERKAPAHDGPHHQGSPRSDCELGQTEVRIDAAPAGPGANSRSRPRCAGRFTSGDL